MPQSAVSLVLGSENRALIHLCKVASVPDILALLRQKRQQRLPSEP
jgi:hypothetical protein